MKSKIIIGIFVSVTFGLMSFISFQKLSPRNSPEVTQLSNENKSLAKEYHKLIDEHKELNRQYVEKHGYTESTTTTTGALFIIPYGSVSKTRVKVHTPAMVKIEYHQKDIKSKFDDNNEKLFEKHANQVTLDNSLSETESAGTGNMANAMIMTEPWVLLIGAAIASITTICLVIEYANERKD